MDHQFQLPGSYKKWTYGLIGAGVIALLYGFIMFHPLAHAGHGENVNSTRFWAVLLQNSVFFLLVVNAAMFFICVTTMAMAGWVVAFRRVSEAISSVVPILGVITFVILMAIVFGGRTDIYHWLDTEAVAKDHILNGKSGFLNAKFYAIWSFLTIFLWWFLGRKMRSLSLESDKKGPMDYETGKKWIWNNTVWASLYCVVFTLTVASTIPWLWLMSIDAHWYSTMYSWYTFASTFVSGMSLIALFVIYLKNRNQLPYVTEEHLHDLGKFMFAFSVFWTYLWFSQYMLIWYSNQPEETKYFIERIGTAEKAGPYKGLFFFNLIVNFLCPLLILMRRGTKRNWTMVTIMAVLIIFGHWIDLYQMVMPGTLHEHFQLMPFEFGVACLFIGLIMWGVGNYLTRHSLLVKNHPFLKESMIHHT
ncbi:MAG: quinol:cytochrome C oxidoreductase [Ferruginibacter sp.]|nr:quinol:cytochrome C oxidoreductase [Ferruginibacter sp.]MBU9935453.1 quinol:cytochrome C oxidoreductase [Ferruginibacter sp.]